jgi:hypothetical protein
VNDFFEGLAARMDRMPVAGVETAASSAEEDADAMA